MLKKTIFAILIIFAMVFCSACSKDKQDGTAAPDTDAKTEQSEGQESEPTATTDSTEQNSGTKDKTPASSDGKNEAEVSSEPTDDGKSETADTPSGTDTTDTSEPDSTTTPDTTEPTTPDTTEPDSDEPDSDEPDTSAGPPSPEECTYEMYNNMTGYEQKDFLESFPSVEEFFNWYHKAKDEYDKQNPEIEIGDGPITIG